MDMDIPRINGSTQGNIVCYRYISEDLMKCGYNSEFGKWLFIFPKLRRFVDEGRHNM